MVLRGMVASPSPKSVVSCSDCLHVGATCVDSCVDASLDRLSSSSGLRQLTPEELCELHGADVCRFAAHFARRSEDADDIAQQALLNAIRGLDTYDSRRGDLRGWLWRIVANTARDAARRERTRHLLIDRVIGMLRTAPLPEEAIERRANDIDLFQSIGRLRARDRVLIAMRFGAGLSTAEIGEAMGLSPGAAQRALRRALDQLKKDLGGSR